MPLFKYVTLHHEKPDRDRIDILVNQEIRFTQLGEFNDPFEMPVYIEQAVEMSELKQNVEKNLREKVKTGYQKLSPRAKRREPFKKFYKDFKDRTLNELDQSLDGQHKKLTSDARGILQQAIQKNGVLSLTETQDNLLMWSHYSGQHTGMVIEFDESHSFFDELKITGDNSLLFHRVKYSDIRPNWKTIKHRKMQDIMLTKSSEWSYEKEVRIVKAFSDAKRTIPKLPYDICLFDMPATAIKRVILGARVSPADTDRIKNILRTTPHLGHIRLQQACLDERRFALNFADC
jgi:hypothetical protein